MNKRERNIGIVVGAVVGGALLWSIIIEPVLESRTGLKTQISTARVGLQQDLNLINRRTDLENRWKQNLTRGLMYDSTSALSQLNNTLNQMATEVGLREMQITSNSNPVQANRPTGRAGVTVREKGFLKLTCRFTAKGGMQQISSFVYRLQNANIPIRITELDIKTETENSDQLAINLTAATIFLEPEGGTGRGDPLAQAPATNRAGRGSTTASTTRQEARP
jgi:hypothetical protein